MVTTVVDVAPSAETNSRTWHDQFGSASIAETTQCLEHGLQIPVRVEQDVGCIVDAFVIQAGLRGRFGLLQRYRDCTQAHLDNIHDGKNAASE